MNDAWTDFIVPKVYAESGIGNVSTASSWVGLGGVNGDNPLWQAGITEWTQTLLFFQTAGYSAWWQLAPNESSENDISMNVNNGNEVSVEVWVCDPTEDYANVPPRSINSALCAQFHNYSTNDYWFFNTPLNCVLNCSNTSFQTAEVIQEWNDNGANDYAQFNQFAFLPTGYGTGVSDSLNNVASPLGGPSGHDPFTTQLWEIGTSSRVIGGACIGDNPPRCDDSGSYLYVNWVRHR